MCRPRSACHPSSCPTAPVSTDVISDRAYHFLRPHCLLSLLLPLPIQRRHDRTTASYLIPLVSPSNSPLPSSIAVEALASCAANDAALRAFKTTSKTCLTRQALTSLACARLGHPSSSRRPPGHSSASTQPCIEAHTNLLLNTATSSALRWLPWSRQASGWSSPTPPSALP